MSDDYIIEVNDVAGLFTALAAEDWPSCLRVVRDLARRYPHKHVSAYNAAQLDVDTDGLTDDQRDEMIVAVDEGRGR